MIDFPVGLGIGLPFKHEQNFFSVSDQDPDPDSIRSVDPDSESGSGSRWAKMTQKNVEISLFEALHVLFSGLKASSVAWTSFMEA